VVEINIEAASLTAKAGYYLQGKSVKILPK
jgi:hypothetical protein